jgi:hypothetical protein
VAGAGSPLDDGGVIVIASEAKQSIAPTQQVWIASSLSLLAMTRHFVFSALDSKNTPCSPNMFQTHQGRFSGTGRP